MPSGCPTTVELELLLKESLPAADAARLDKHLQRCAACREMLNTLAGGDGSWLKAKQTQTIDPVTSPPLREAMNRLKVGDPMLPSEKAGDMIGRYKLREQIGEGGCGIVYVAEQSEPVRRRLALKIIKLGMDTRSVIARFEAERQALALMDHPNIAKVFDAGATETGRPYFVMELVRGRKITEYCDEKKLSTRERLDLFIQVCQAIQHAHQKGIIHRDIKPSNILVTVNDGAPVPKVIDFGIAKATNGQQLTDKTIYTAFEQFIGTPAYMSPEQAVLTSLDIDTRSDIYALGVLLYELLTGKTPFDAKALLVIGLDELRRTIREQEPPRPSTRLSTLPGEELNTTAQHRGLEAPKLVSELRGDLDWIVMKSLEKDRARRYETANGLAMDIQRHLSNEPVVACPPSAAYRFQKMVRRNKLVFAATGGITAALIIGLGIATWMFFKERQARRQAVTAREQAEANFNTARDAIDRMFTRVAEELTGQPRMEQVRRKLLEDALQYYEGFLKQKGEDPTVRHSAALAYLRVGSIYELLGQYDKSLEPLEQGIAMLEDLAKRHPVEARDREEMAHAHGVLAYANYSLGRSSDALALRRTALALTAELQHEFPTEPRYLLLEADAHVDLGNALRLLDRQNEAIDHFLQALRLCEKRRADFPDLPEDRVLLAHVHHWLGASLYDLGELPEAERHYRESRNLRTQLVAEQPQDARMKHLLSHAEQYLAELLMHTGRLREADELLRHAIENDETILNAFPAVGEYRRRAGWDYEYYGKLLAALRRMQEAEAALRRSLAIREKLSGDFPEVERYRRELAGNWYQLGILFEGTDRSAEAAEAFGKAIGLIEKLMAEKPTSPDLQTQLGRMLAACPAARFRNPQRAVTLLKQALQLSSTLPDRWTYLGIAQYRTGETTAAIESLNKSMELAKGGDARQWLFLAMTYWQIGERVQARQWYDKAAAWIEKVHPADESYVRFQAEAAGLMEVAK